MKKLLFTFLIINTVSYSQEPFSTPFREPLAMKVVERADGVKEYELVRDRGTIQKIVENEFDSSSADEIVITGDKPRLGFFKNNTLSANIIGDQSRFSINSEVLFFKLYIASPSSKVFKKKKLYDKNGDEKGSEIQENYEARVPKYKWNLPLMLISKLSTSYDSISSSGAIDALDYEAAPITLRVMPSFVIDFHNYTDRINLGFYADLRGLNVSNDIITDTNDLEFIGSGGIGFTYQGDGEAGIYNEEGNYTEGKYSISAILQGATGKEEVIQGLFNTDKKYTTSFQGYFIYNSIGDTRFDIKIGYQYFFDRTIGGSRSNFTIGISN